MYIVNLLTFSRSLVKMALFKKSHLFFIMIFYILQPSLDMATDLSLVVKLLRGPSDNLTIRSSKSTVSSSEHYTSQRAVRRKGRRRRTCSRRRSRS